MRSPGHGCGPPAVRGGLAAVEIRAPAAAVRTGGGHDAIPAVERACGAPGTDVGHPRFEAASRPILSMDALVTGGTGFVGANVVRELLREGATVRVLAREGGDRRALAGLAVEIVEGDLREPAAVRRAVAGVGAVFHVAADYRLWAPDARALYATNVDGTRALLEASVSAGVRRIVYTSTVGALGLPKAGGPGTEDTPVTLGDMVGAYKRSKFLAEQVALQFARAGAPVVVVNPSAPVGPWDVKPTPTGQMLVDFLRGRMIGSLDTGLNVVHVRDVARGHLLAAERGRPGEKYILGHANLTLAQIFGTLAEITGRRAPRLRVPYAVAWLAAAGMEGAAWVTRRPPRVPLTAVRMARKRMFFSPAKAVRELGLPQTPVREAMADAVAWFTEHGYASGRARAQAVAT